MLGLVGDILTEGRHEIVGITDGEAALSRIQKEDFDLVLCDYKLPRKSGRHLFEEARRARPEVEEKFVFMTACLVSEEMEHFFRDNRLTCLMKPFTRQDLLAAIDPKLKL